MQINGKSFAYYGGYKSKDTARGVAGKIRRLGKGHMARVIPNPYLHKWEVYYSGQQILTGFREVSSLTPAETKRYLAGKWDKYKRR